MQEREDVQGGRASPSAFGDDASDAQFFSINECPPLAFECHQKIFDIYLKKIN